MPSAQHLTSGDQLVLDGEVHRGKPPFVALGLCSAQREHGDISASILRVAPRNFRKGVPLSKKQDDPGFEQSSDEQTGLMEVEDSWKGVAGSKG